MIEDRIFGVLSCLLLAACVSQAADDDYNVVHRDGSFEFGYNNPDSYHYADANRNNVVRGEFGGRNPGTGAIDSTVYTAGPRGYRPRGKNVVRKYDLSQSGPRPIGSPDDPYYDPFEDPSYNFGFRTRTYTRQENANRVGDVTGKYSYIDDVGERHNVDFIAGKNTGFHVKTPFPDSNPRAYGPLYFNGRGRPIPRGRTSIQRGLDGSYKFVSAGPDQRRTETSDATGHVRGSYTYLDDKGVQHSVHYIAGPETGYRVLKNVKGPHLPTVFPFGRPGIIPPDFYDYLNKEGDLFDTAATGGNEGSLGPPKKDQLPGFDNGINKKPSRPSGGRPSGGYKPTPNYDEDGSDTDFNDLFNNFDSGSTTVRPGIVSTTEYLPSKPDTSSSNEDGSYKPSGNDGSYKPSSEDTFGSRPGTSSTARPGFGSSTSKPTPGLFDNDDFGDDSNDGDLFDNNINKKPSNNGYPTGPSRPTSRPSGTTFRPPSFGNGRPSGTRPQNRPNYDYDSGNDGDFGLFGSDSDANRPPYNSGKPIGSNNKENCKRCRGTIVTNLGDKYFSIPPGVSVRAHVQAIDLLPFNSNIPSPSEQLKSEINIQTEQLNSRLNTIVHTNSTESTTVSSSEEGTTEKIPNTSTTTLTPPSTTLD